MHWKNDKEIQVLVETAILASNSGKRGRGTIKYRDAGRLPSLMQPVQQF